MITNKGFTLFEIMLVMVIGITVTALGVVSLNRVQKVFSLRSSGDEIRSSIQYGRELAIANQNRAIYSVAYSNGSFRLLADNKEMRRYQLPTGMTLYPASINWNFSPVTGTLASCNPCQLTLSLGTLTEVININENGSVY